MQYFCCDLCLQPIGDARFTVQIDVVEETDHAPVALTANDLAEDNLAALSQMLQAESASDHDREPSPPREPVRSTHRYDLCEECHTQFARDPLGIRRRQRFEFSEN